MARGAEPPDADGDAGSSSPSFDHLDLNILEVATENSARSLGSPGDDAICTMGRGSSLGGLPRPRPAVAGAAHPRVISSPTSSLLLDGACDGAAKGEEGAAGADDDDATEIVSSDGGVVFALDNEPLTWLSGFLAVGLGGPRGELGT